ncbi:hypothetical protein ACPYO6_10160 [Georgenia sp. Z1344]|uniref:hypothetical protein n=1 Tax=Georgenia sp. Z1344 TaxID=3416706 RepID=UPI003CF9A1D0
MALVALGVVVLSAPAPPRATTIRAELTLSPPPEFSAETPYVFSLETMLAFTAAVDEAYDARYPSTQLSTPNASLFGNQVLDGVSVTSSRSGTQWQEWQDRPSMIVTATGPTEAAALATIRTTIAQVAEVTTDIQVGSGVPAAARIRLLWQEDTFTIGSIGRTDSSAVKGAAVLGLVALGAATAVASGLDRAGTQLRRDRSETSVGRTG